MVVNLLYIYVDGFLKIDSYESIDCACEFPVENLSKMFRNELSSSLSSCCSLSLYIYKTLIAWHTNTYREVMLMSRLGPYT